MSEFGNVLELVEAYPLYLKAMGSRYYDEGGITFPDLDYGRRLHRFVDERIPGARATAQFTEVNGRFNVEGALVLMGARDMAWAKPWSNMPKFLFFKKLVDALGQDVDEVCDEAGEVLYDLGLIIRPSDYWIPE